MKADVYKMVTDRIVEQMNNGIIPWRRPWHGAVGMENVAISYTTRRAYSLINQYLLGEAGEYLTYNQIQKLGGKVKKGAKSKFVVFFEKIQYTKQNEETGEDELHTYPLLKYYNVFHLSDTEGIQSKIVEGEKVEFESDADADKIIADYVARTGLTFHNDKPSSRAYYCPSSDTVVVPMMNQYDKVGEYYSTTFHELTHSTMKKDRCDREADNKMAAFGSADYSREELVAEIGSAYLCNATGIETEQTFKNSVAYLQSWIAALKNDNKMIVWAASRAEKAANFILNK